jgi:hypothetical protein
MPISKIFSRKYSMHWLIGAGAALLLAAAGLWCFKLSVTPERVFWGMLEQSLSTSGVSMHSTMEQGNARLQQNVQYSLGGQNRAISVTKLHQGEAEVVTEVIGTPQADYTRYAHIKTDRVDAAGKTLDVSKVLDVWAKTENSENRSELIGQSILGLSVPLGGIPVPIGNLNSEQRAKLLTQIKNEGVYEVSFKDAKKERKDGRLRYIYEIKVQTIPYVHLMKEFAKATGLHELDDVDPNNYQAPPMSIKLTVDARSRHLVAVEIPDTGFKQTFKSYDVPVAFQIPKDTVPAEELQKRLNELQ